MNRPSVPGRLDVKASESSAPGTTRPTKEAERPTVVWWLLAVVAVSVFSAQACWASLAFDVSPPGVSAGTGLSPLNEFLAGGFGMGGSGSGGEIGDGISFDPTTRILHFEVAYGSAGGFSDLSGPAFAWYLHGPSLADRVGPFMVNLAPLHQFATDPAKGGSLDGLVLLTQTEADALVAELTYLNFYTSDFPGGEIRGQLVVAVPIPEPVGWPGVLFPLAFLAWRRFGARTRAVLTSPFGGGSGD